MVVVAVVVVVVVVLTLTRIIKPVVAGQGSSIGLGMDGWRGIGWVKGKKRE